MGVEHQAQQRRPGAPDADHERRRFVNAAPSAQRLHTAAGAALRTSDSSNSFSPSADLGQRVDRMLGMGHQADDVAAFVGNLATSATEPFGFSPAA